MANTTTVTVRLPMGLKKEAENLVKDGFFKNISDLLVYGVRREVKDHKVSWAVREAREAKKEIWEDCLKRANGDPEKAADIMFEDIKKIEAEW